MKAKVLVSLAVLILVLPALALAGGSASTACKTKYPIVLAHGMFASAKIIGLVDYWWGIPDALEDEGASVYITSVNAMDGTVNKAKSFKTQFLQILAVTGKAKANIIGHSHGTVYTRYAITNLGLGTKVASLTSLSGPHKGSALGDLLAYGIPGPIQALAGSVIDWLYVFVMGDTDPNFTQNCFDVTRDYMTKTFNPNTPNVAGIYYQSWAAKVKWSTPSIVLEPLWLIMLAYEGANDGIVGVESAKWGNYRGEQAAAWYSPGVDHMGMVGHLFGLTPGFNAPAFYVSIVKDLKARSL